jgi:hypothetical protein
MDTLDPKLKEALMNLPGGFAEMQREHNLRFKGIEDKIIALPKTIFETKVKVKNGSEKEISFLDAVTQNWERTAKLETEIKEGSILVPIMDDEDKESYMKLADILTKLYRRPSMWFSKGAKLSENFVWIAKFVFGVVVVIYIIVNFFKG